MRRYFYSFLFAVSFLSATSQPVYDFNKPDKYPRLLSFQLQEVTVSKNQVNINGEGLSLYVYVFLSPECPLCRHYLPKLKKIQDLYKNRVVIKGIFPGKSYSADTLKFFSEEYAINFPLYIDSSKLLTTYLSASVTPEVMVFTKNMNKIYEGAIDDWMKELGQVRVKPSQMYLEDAVSAALQGKKIIIPKTIAKGCLINDL